MRYPACGFVRPVSGPKPGFAAPSTRPVCGLSGRRRVPVLFAAVRPSIRPPVYPSTRPPVHPFRPFARPVGRAVRFEAVRPVAEPKPRFPPSAVHHPPVRSVGFGAVCGSSGQGSRSKARFAACPEGRPQGEVYIPGIGRPIPDSRSGYTSCLSPGKAY